MAEAIVISGFLIVLIILQLKEQKKIIIYSEINWMKRVIAILLAIALAVIFWQPQLSDQIKIIIFSGLILFLGFTKEGLSEGHLVKFGFLSGDLNTFKFIQIEETKTGKSFVSFYRKKNNRFSMIIPMPSENLVSFFNNQQYSGEIIVGNFPEEIRNNS